MNQFLSILRWLVVFVPLTIIAVDYWFWFNDPNKFPHRAPASWPRLPTVSEAGSVLPVATFFTYSMIITAFCGLVITTIEWIRVGSYESAFPGIKNRVTIAYISFCIALAALLGVASFPVLAAPKKHNFCAVLFFVDFVVYMAIQNGAYKKVTCAAHRVRESKSMLFRQASLVIYAIVGLTFISGPLLFSSFFNEVCGWLECTLIALVGLYIHSFTVGTAWKNLTFDIVVISSKQRRLSSVPYGPAQVGTISTQLHRSSESKLYRSL